MDIIRRHCYRRHYTAPAVTAAKTAAAAAAGAARNENIYFAIYALARSHRLHATGMRGGNVTLAFSNSPLYNRRKLRIFGMLVRASPLLVC